MDIKEGKVYTLQETAEFLKADESTIRRMISNGKLKKIQGLRRVRIFGKELLRFINE